MYLAIEALLNCIEIGVSIYWEQVWISWANNHVMTLFPLPGALGSWYCSEKETLFPAACLLWVSSRSVGKFLPIHQTFYSNLCPQTYYSVRKVPTVTIGVGITQSLTGLPIWLYWVWFPAGVCDLSLSQNIQSGFGAHTASYSMQNFEVFRRK